MFNAPMMTMMRMMAATAGRKYVSATLAGCAVGCAVAAGAGSTANAVVACEPQYDSLPPYMT